MLSLALTDFVGKDTGDILYGAQLHFIDPQIKHNDGTGPTNEAPVAPVTETDGDRVILNANTDLASSIPVTPQEPIKDKRRPVFWGDQDKMMDQYKDEGFTETILEWWYSAASSNGCDSTTRHLYSNLDLDNYHHSWCRWWKWWRWRWYDEMAAVKRTTIQIKKTNLQTQQYVKQLAGVDRSAFLEGEPTVIEQPTNQRWLRFLTAMTCFAHWLLCRHQYEQMMT